MTIKRNSRPEYEDCKGGSEEKPCVKTPQPAGETEQHWHQGLDQNVDAYSRYLNLLIAGVSKSSKNGVFYKAHI